MQAAGLVAAEHAVQAAGPAVLRWWRELAGSADRVLTTPSLHALLDNALAAIGRVLGADAVALLVADERAGRLVARRAVGFGTDATLREPIPAGSGVAGQILAAGSPVVIDDLRRVEVASPGLRASGLRSLVGAQLGRGPTPLGVLYAGSRTVGRFSADDAAVLQDFADRLAAASERVRAFETERDARFHAEDLAGRLAHTQEITAALARATTAEEVAGVLATSLPDAHTGTSWAGLWSAAGDRIAAITPNGPGGSASVPAPAADRGSGVPVAAAYQDQVAIHVPDAARATYGAPAPGWKPACAAYAAVPVTSGTAAHGVLVVTYRTPQVFDADQRAFLRIIAAQCALAADRAGLLAARAELAERSSYLAGATRVIAGAADLPDALARLARLALGALGDVCFVDIVGEHGGIERMVALHQDPSRQHLADRLRDEPEPFGGHVVADVVATGTSRWAAHTVFGDDAAGPTGGRAAARSLGLRSYLAVPLATADGTLGCLTVAAAKRRFGPLDVAFAERLAAHVAVVIATASRLQSSVETSRTLQARLMPRDPPDVPGLAVHSRYLPAASGLEVGGDFFDVVAMPDGAVVFAVGDVAGHDRDAAALMGSLRSACRALAVTLGDPGTVVSSLQRHWDLLGFPRMATGMLGRLDPATGSLSLASAGHHPPLLVGAGRARYLPVTPGTVFGAPPVAAPVWHGSIGDEVLLLYTDGAVDERQIGGGRGMDRLAHVAAIGPAEPVAVCDRVVAMLDAVRVDDVALLALQRMPERAMAHEQAGPARIRTRTGPSHTGCPP